MPHSPAMNRAIIVSLAVVPLYAAAAFADQPAIAFKPVEDGLEIVVGDDVLATYIYRDDAIFRPYFTNVHAPGGVRVTRHHPPRTGIDSTDHATMHPGIWLAFGDVSGHDFWRNKARVEHVRFVESPQGGKGEGSFSVENRYIADGNTICTEICRHRFVASGGTCLLTYESEFTGEEEFYFGDQEELGLGVRVRNELRVKGGEGRIQNADGLVDEANVWGKQSDWCDYSGTVDGRRLGLLLMPSPQNFRQSWCHARDYGFMAANPFGRNAFTRGEKSRVPVEPGETFRLRYGVLVYSLPADEQMDLEQAYRKYVKLDAQ